MKLSKKSPIVQVFSAVATKKELTEVQKADYKDAVEHIKELASDPNPMNLYELNQIIAYTVDTVIDTRLDYLDRIAEVRRTGVDERPKFKTKTEGIRAYWQAIGGTPQSSRVGFKYSELKLEELSAMPEAEWMEIATGRYDFAELIRDVTNEFEAKIAQKVQDTLYAAFSNMPSPNYASGNGIVSNAFDPLLNAMRRFGAVAITGDFEALQKLPALTAVSGSVSPNIIDEFNRTGLIGFYKGCPVVALNNPYTGWDGFDTVLNKGYIYIVPTVEDSRKTVKVQLAGETRSMQVQNIADASYQMRFDRLVGAGVVDARHALAVYEDETLSGA